MNVIYYMQKLGVLRFSYRVSYRSTQYQLYMFVFLRCFIFVVFVLIVIIFCGYCWIIWSSDIIEKIVSKDLNKFDEYKKSVFFSVINDGVNLKKRLLKVIIIGLNKFGIRVLLVILKMYLDIKVCLDEVYFFNREENYQFGLEWYRVRMFEFIGDQLIIEKFFVYFIISIVFERVYNMFKNIKFLVIVRDLIIRVILEYIQLVLKFNSFFLKFEDYVITK